ncbi:MAG: cyclodeaminase/cyclohydrolase family protein [Phycisphaerales bacterium]|jgi:formiminotetrahydrofolate cyclodeaminase|nr:cyclodeaminase/cyclohydrolase family protein [Phycisphaerales bacterium]
MELQELKVESLLRTIGEKQPVPGGGAAACVTAAIGLAAGRMVLAYSLGRADLESFEQDNTAAIQELEAWRDESMALAEADAKAFAVLSSLWKLPADDPERVAAWHPAVVAAIDAPLAMCRLCRNACELLASLPGRTNPMLASDLAVAAILLQAACASAAWNVRINLPSLDCDLERARLAGEAEDDVQRCRELCAAIEQACDQ